MVTDFSRKEKIVGAFVIFVTVLLLATVILLGRGKGWFKAYRSFFTVFDQSYNLKASAAVKLYNTEVGYVKRVHLEKNQVKVTLMVLEEYAGRIRGDSVATVESPTLIGSEFVSITAGSKTSYVVPEGGMIRSAKKKSVSDILAEFQVEKTVKMLINAIQKISDTAETLSSPEGPLMMTLNNANRTTGHLRRIMADIEAGKGSVGGLLKSDRLLSDIHGQLDRVARILDPIASATARAPGVMDQVQHGLAGVDRIENEISANLRQVEAILEDLQQGMESLNAILDNARSGSADIPAITRSARGGIEEIRGTVENVDKIVESAKKNPLIRGNLPAEPGTGPMDSGLRP